MILTLLLFIPEIKLPMFFSKPRVVILIDDSKSMNEEGKMNQLGTLQSKLRRLQTVSNLKYYYFSDSLRPGKSLSSVTFGGKNTDIFGALSKLDNSNSDAILMISDGRNNSHNNPNLKMSDIPLWAQPIGSGNVADLSIEEAFLVSDSINSISNQLLKIRLRSTFKQEVKDELQVFEGSKLLETIDLLILPSKLTEITVPVTDLKPQSELLIVLDSIEEEDRLDNNSISVTNPFNPSSINVLFIAGVISRETEVIRNELNKINDFNVESAIELASGKPLSAAKQTYDVVIIGPLQHNISKSTVNLIKGYSNRKVPILFIQSASGIPADLADLFPLQAVKSRNNTKDISTPISDIFFSTWEPENLHSEETSYSNKPGTQALYGKKGNIFLASMMPAKRILALEMPDLPAQTEWNQEGFKFFLRASVRYLLDPEGFPFRIVTNNSSANYISMILESEIPVSAGSLEAWLNPDSIKLVPAFISSNKIKLTASVNAPKKEYFLEVRWGKKTYSPGKGFKIMPQEPESPSRGANIDFLRSLAENNRGQLITSPEGFELFMNSLPKRKTLILKPLQTPIIVILIGSLLMLEIWQRRKKGLP